MAEEFDIGPLSWVKDEIDQALKSVLENLQSLAANPDNVSALRFSQTHLFQVSGALDMVGLQGCKRYSAEIEKVVGKLEKKSLPADEQAIETLKQSILLLQHYLQLLLNGAPDTPLSLLPALQKLAELQGETIEAQELFFPDTDIRVPRSVMEPDAVMAQYEEPDDAAAVAIAARQRPVFQAALLKWLKTSSNESLQAMRGALDTVMHTQKAAAQKTFWWLAGAFVDVLAEEPIARQQPVKLLCRKLDQQLRELGLGKARATGNLLRDMLFYIARSHSTGERIAQARELFELDALLPAEPLSIASALDEAGTLNAMSAMLGELCSAWSAVAAGSADKLPGLTTQLAAAAAASRTLQQPALTALLDKLHSITVAMQQDAGGKSEPLLVEVAASLNLLEDVLAERPVLGSEAAHKLESQIQRLQKAAIGEVAKHGASGKQDGNTLLAVARQVKDALQLVELTLDTYFRNPAEREVLKTAEKPLEQVLAAFDMLDLPTPAAIAAKAAGLVRHFYANTALTQENAQKQFEQLAESLSMLGFFVDEFPRIRQESLHALDDMLARLEAEPLPQPAADEAAGDDAGDVIARVTETPAARPGTARARGGRIQAIKTQVGKAPVSKPEADAGIKTATAASPGQIDPELLETFISEAEEVLAALARNLQALRVNTTDRAALAELRRGYHTLKGSGRTLGLVGLGEIAQAVEKLLNRIIEQDVLPSAGQLTFVEKASAAFSTWVAELAEKSVCEPSFAEWQAEAQALEAESESQKSASEAAEVLIGGTRKIGRTLFNIFTGEAKQHLESLQHEYAGLQAAPAGFNNESLIRSAHTLASNAGATGFKSIADLARALETWVDGHAADWDGKSLTLLGNVITALGDMLAKVEALAEPKRASGLLTALKKATEKDKQTVPREKKVANETPAADLESVRQETPAEAATAEAGRDEELSQADMADSIVVTSPPDQELLSIFTEEALELVPQIGNALRAWRKAPHDGDYADTLQRALHTLKGSARMAGQSEIGDVVHDLEDQIAGLAQRNVTPDDFDKMFRDVDSIGISLEQLTAAEPLQEEAAAVAGRTQDRRTQSLRLRADVLDRLINEAGEISIARSRIEREMLAFKHLSQDLTESVARLRTYLRELEIETESQMQSRMTLLQETQEAFDPLEFDRFTRLQELTRMMAESVNDVSTIQNGLLGNLDETDAALQQQGRMNRELQYGLMNVRMVPFATVSERMHRIVRQTAQELKKTVDLTIEGEHVEIDRSVLDKIGAPLEHLLRNSVGHGIETAVERKKQHKSENGNIQLAVRRENDEITITVSDDGAGIDLDKVREKAIESGLLPAGQEVSEQSLLAIIFEAGFSTAADVTQISGRGVGLDAVRGDIIGLGGRIEVVNSPEHGATFTIYLPVTLSVAQVVMVRSGTHVYAVPSIMVEQLQKLKPEQLAAAKASGIVQWAGRDYSLHYFARLIGDAELQPEVQTYTPVLLLRSGTNRIALQVDEIAGNQEVVMKPIGVQLARVPGITGATVTGDGKIVLIVNPVLMANREMIVVSHTRMVAAEAPAVSRPVLLVVDDSLTMRKVLSRTLEREGYLVVSAKDGMDALQVMQENRPDIILLDIEMPRMDGFEFARNIRGDKSTAGIPIIMISSRTAEKHQAHARELGVNAFLGKPVQDDDLLTEINIQLGKSGHAPQASAD